jgi:drug/metabolite transporter (DMT)-like permease
MICIGQAFNVIGTFVSAPYKNITMWEAYKMSMPYVLVQRVTSSIAIQLSHEHKYFTNNQIVFLMLLMQFIFTAIYSYFILKKTASTSDWIGILLLTVGYYISYFKQVSTNLTM